MTAPLTRDRQIELMTTVEERANALAKRLLAHPTIRSVAACRSLKEAQKTTSAYKTVRVKKVG